MTGDYALYVAAAYALCFLVLGGVALASIVAWKKASKDLNE